MSAPPARPGTAEADLATERAVLGATLGGGIAELATLLVPEEFAHPPHAEVFAACLALFQEGRPLDPILVANKLKERGSLARVGGLSFLAELDQGAPYVANAREYARDLRDAHARRQGLALGAEFSRRLAAGEPPADVFGDAAQRLGQLGQVVAERGPERLNLAMERTLDLLDRMQANPGGVSGLATGLRDLDRMLTGMHPGELLVLAARPGVGKTSAALNWAAHAALEEKRAVLVFSLEMPTDQLTLRLLASEGRVSLKRLREGGLEDADQAKVNSAAAALYQAPVFIDDDPMLTPMRLRLKAKALKREQPSLGLIVVDYLQLMSGDGRAESKEQEVASISQALKRLAKELGLPILALSQLNREVEKRKGPPMLSDLRNSGAVEQDADVVMFLHPSEPEAEEPPAPGVLQVDLIVAKQRNGPTGAVSLVMLQEFTRFEARRSNGSRHSDSLGDHWATRPSG